MRAEAKLGPAQRCHSRIDAGGWRCGVGAGTNYGHVDAKRGGNGVKACCTPVSKKPMPTMHALTMAVTNSVRSPLRSRNSNTSCRPKTALSWVENDTAYTESLGIVSLPTRASSRLARSWSTWKAVWPGVATTSSTSARTGAARWAS
eukprot:scaffold2448_cov119-Isochrysis_galbana.AAC.10